MNSLHIYFGIAFLLATFYVEMILCQRSERRNGMKKNFRKSNKIAHFMGKRTENDMDPYLDFGDEIEAGIPQNGGFPGFPRDRTVPSYESMEKFPYRRTIPDEEIKVAHIFGRHLSQDSDTSGPFPNDIPARGARFPLVPYLEADDFPSAGHTQGPDLR